MGKLETELGRPATDEEISRELGISEDEYTDWQGQANISNIISLDEFIEASGEKGIATVRANPFEQPEEVVEKAEIRKLLAESLDGLTDKEKR